jgi:hypothetical protein
VWFSHFISSPLPHADTIAVFPRRSVTPQSAINQRRVELLPAGSRSRQYEVQDVASASSTATCEALVAPQVSAKRLTMVFDGCDPAPKVRADETGHGIAADQLERIFEPFVQSKKALKPSDQGVGLGLAISRQLARAMHGDLTVRSAPGQGSTFTLTLPRGGSDRSTAGDTASRST